LLPARVVMAVFRGIRLTRDTVLPQ
jgi:hypothetical protein